MITVVLHIVSTCLIILTLIVVSNTIKQGKRGPRGPAGYPGPAGMMGRDGECNCKCGKCK